MSLCRLSIPFPYYIIQHNFAVCIARTTVYDRKINSDQLLFKRPKAGN